jgi:hypothetical protein
MMHLGYSKEQTDAVLEKMKANRPRTARGGISSPAYTPLPKPTSREHSLASAMCPRMVVPLGTPAHHADGSAPGIRGEVEWMTMPKPELLDKL